MKPWLVEVLYAIRYFFLQPTLYIFFVSSLLVGYVRVRKERKEFSFKVHDMLYELRTSLFAGVKVGLLLSIVLVGAGIVLTKASFVMIGLVTFVCALLLRYHALSAAYVVGVTIFFFLFQPHIAALQPFFKDGKETSLSALALLLGMLLFVEGRLIAQRAIRETTPRLMRGKRGMTIGLHVTKRLWLIPLVAVVPGDGIREIFAWWPVISVQTHTFSLIVFPFLLGFANRTKGMLPSQSIFYIGRRVTALGVFVAALALASVWVPIVAVVGAGIAMFGRFFITMQAALRDQKAAPYFSPQKVGLMVLDTMPHSAAQEMGLQPGEIITKVNGLVPHTIEDFHEAFAQKGAFCKLEVMDVRGELRLFQHAIYADYQHDLGILFVERENWKEVI